MMRKITLIATGNGTVEIFEDGEVSGWSESGIGAILLIGAVFNLTLMGVTTTIKNKRHLLQLVTALSFVNTYDSIINQTLSLLFVLEWYDTGPPMFLCRFSMGSTIFCIVLQFFYIVCILILTLPNKKKLPVILYVAVPPLVSSALVAPPILIDGVAQIHHYVQRNSCGITGDNVVYSTALLIIGFGTSISAVVYFLFVMKCYFCNSSIFAFNAGLETRDQRYAAFLLLVSFSTLIPYTVSMIVTNFIPLNSFKKITTNTPVSKIFTGGYDIFFTFLKSQFNILTPFVTFLCYKELRKQFTNLFCFCRNNSVSNSSLSFENVERRLSKLTVSQESTPVLFCTTGGLVLRMLTTESDNKYLYKSCDQCNETESVMQSLVTDISINVKKRTGPKRKIVRFAHSVKEIPPSLSEWDNTSTSDTEQNSSS